MISYNCNEETLLNEAGSNEAILDSFVTVPKSEGSNTKDVEINILVPISDKPGVRKIKVVAGSKRWISS